MSFEPMDNGWRKHLKSGGVGSTDVGKLILNVELGKTDTEVGQVMAWVDGKSKLWLEEGKRYTVTTDSGTYTCECTLDEEGRHVIAGYAGSVPEDDEVGYTSVVAILGSIEDDTRTVVVIDIDCGTHMSVREAETVHTIDSKYLPGVCLPMVELTTEVPDAGIAELSADESAKLTEAYETGLPVCLKVIVGGIQASLVAVHIVADPGMLTVYLAGGALTFMQNETGWVGSLGTG